MDKTRQINRPPIILNVSLFAADSSNVLGDCPVMCGNCKADGSPGDDFIPVPVTQLLSGDGGNTGGNSGGNNGGNNDGNN